MSIFLTNDKTVIKIVGCGIISLVLLLHGDIILNRSDNS